MCTQVLVRFFVGVCALLVVSSCANQQSNKIAVEEGISQAQLSQKAFEDALPKAVSDTLLNGSNASPSVASTKEERFDVSVNRIPAKTFFLSLVSDSGVNVVAHPELEGTISLELKNVTVTEVLNVTREVFGYEYKYQSGIYTIFPRKLRTEIFPINYLDVKRVGVTDTSVLIGEITSSSGGNNNNSNNNNNNNNGNSNNSSGGNNLLSFLEDGESSNTRSAGISPGTRVQTLTTADFWSGINKAIIEIIGGDAEGRFVMTNPQSGLVVVKAMPRELNAVRDFLERSELSAKRQVVLETKILEVTLNDGFEAGINWGAITGELSLRETRSGQDTLGQIISGSGAAVVDSLASTVLDVTDITSLLFLLEQQGSVQVLSSPRVSTVNNQKAVIRVGSDEFFVTGLSNSTTASASTILNTPEVELNSFFSGISLDVTPQISEDGDVILHIHPLVSDVQDQIKEINISGEVFSLPLALRDVRESDSIVRAKSGQVVVLGGLMQESTSDVKTKRPFLGDVPIVNTFFKAKQKSLAKTELVILMRPIVVEEGTWSELIGEDAKRIEAISDQYRSR